VAGLVILAGLALSAAIRMDPVQFRVAIPAADPPGNIHMVSNLGAASAWRHVVCARQAK
jgi:hypothetical protein